MTNNYCGNCSWAKVKDVDKLRYSCTRHAPQVIPITQNNVLTSSPQSFITDFHTVWPEVGYDDLCGEWHARYEEEAE